MGTYLLCTGPLAEHPYQIEETGLRIWSAEELCYYIYHNTALLHEGFLKDSLLDFIAKELKLPESAARIRRFRDSQVDLSVKMETVLREFHYYSEDEIQKFHAQMEARKRKSARTIALERADALLHRGRYSSAIGAYRGITENREKPIQDNVSLVAFLHMASAYSRLYLFEEAMECLVNAWKLREDSEVLELLLGLSEFSGVPIPEEVRSSVSAENAVKAAASLQEGIRSAEAHQVTGRAAALMTRDSIRREEGIRSYIAELRREYRSMEG